MTAKEKIYKWIEENREEVTGLLQKLIQAPSVNPYFDEETIYMKEGDAQRVLEAYLKDMGMTTEYTYPDAKKLASYEGKPGYYADHTFEDRPNLYAELKGTGGGRSIMLSGHIDVVQRGSKWTQDPFGGKIIGNRLYGRGAVDMKGGIAAMTCAVKAIQESGMKLKGDIRIGTVVDEEAGGMGTLALVAEGYRADGCLITEPTHLKIAPLCRGILWGELTIEGRAGHIELKQGDFRTGGAVDAIDKASLYLEQFRRLNKEWSVAKEHKYLPIPCQIHIAQFQAGEYPTTFANRAELTFNAQYLPSEKDENGLGSKVKKEIEEFVKQVALTDAWLTDHQPKVEWLIDADCGETLDDQPFFKTVRDSARKVNPDSIVEGICCHTDMGWFCNVGIPTLNIGPGDPRLAHQADEFIEIEELLTCTKMIASIVMNWCGAEENS